MLLTPFIVHNNRIFHCVSWSLNLWRKKFELPMLSYRSCSMRMVANVRSSEMDLLPLYKHHLHIAQVGQGGGLKVPQNVLTKEC